MKQLADYIFRDILHSLKRNSDKQVIRVDGFEDLGLYLRLCKKVKILCTSQGRTLIAKLSHNKFAQFLATNQWPAEAVEMQQNGWVDEDDHMTSYRNMLPEAGKKLVVLLLGTDMVDDKGGLNDFFAITPNKIDSEIGNRYSKLISDELHEAFDDRQIDDVVDRFFGDLFSCVPKNLAQVSDILDHWLAETPTVKEAMVDLFGMLPKWNIPFVSDAAEHLSPTKFISTKGKNSLVIKASSFIRGKTYAKVTKSTIANIKKRFELYKGADGKQPKKYCMEYPEGQKIPSIDKLEEAILSFVMGNRDEVLIHALIHTDFSILDDILNLKLPTNPKPNTITKVTGTPLSVILEVFLNTLNENKQGIDTVRINWQQAKLCGIPSNVEVADASEKDALLLEAWNAVTRFAGGVDEYISHENWLGLDAEAVSLCMEPQGFLSPSSGISLIASGAVASGSGETHKISFSVEALCGDTTIAKEEYCWVVDPNEDWVLAFRDFTNMPDEETCYIPFETIKELNTAYTLKDEDGFAYWITHADVKPLTGKSSIWSTLDHDLSQTNEEDEQAKFYMLGKRFQNFRRDVLLNGFYASINNSASQFLNEYLTLVDHITSSAAYVGKLHTLVGKMTFFFTICANTDPIKGSCSARQVIVPPWHPATLEKICDQMLFIRTGMHEWNMKQANANKSLTKRLDELQSLSSIHNATDAFIRIGSDLLTHGISFGYYTLYGESINEGAFISAQQIERKEAVFDDDFDDGEMKRMSREAHVLLQVIKQYVDTYPQAKRSLAVTFINPEDLQVIVSALYKYVIDLRKEEPDTSTSIRITVVSRNNTQGARTYLAYWINHVFTLDDNLDIKAYLQIYNEEKEIPKLVPSTTDIAFFFDAMNTDQNAGYHFYRASGTEKMSDCRFPMVFKPSLKAKYGLQHSIDITQPQFRAATAHTQLLRVYNDKQQYDFRSALVQTSAADENRGKIIGLVQKRVVWLCCIDSAMDKYTVRKLYAEDTGIIGFTTGEGSYGQMNMAITCRADIVNDMRRRCKRRLHKMFPSWSDAQLDNAAGFCLTKAGELDGVSILRAMNPNDYDMNNFLAYLIANELIEKCKNRLSILIRLDSYRHWFDDEKAEEKKIPDFLLIEADVDVNAPLHIQATVVEAKIANGVSMITEHLPKAQEQVAKGLEVLQRHFDPNSGSIERRYWLAQLYRAIAFLQADTDFDDAVFNSLNEKLNEMIEGHFTISWAGRILGCEIDSNSTLTTSPLYADDLTIDHWQVGQLAMQNILLGKPMDSAVQYDGNATSQEEETIDDAAEATEEEITAEDEIDPSVINPGEGFEPVSDSPAIPENEIPAEEVPAQANPVHEDHPLSELEPSAVITTASSQEIVDGESEHQVNPEPVAKNLEDIRVLIGQDRSKHNICWEFGHKQLANRHLLITGGSGQGKTYAIQTFLYELARQNISSVVFDYTDGFLPGKLEPPFESALEGKIVQHYAIAGQLPINPFKRQPLNIPGLPEGMLEQSTNVASRFSAIMKHVYSFGEQQSSALYQACKEGIDHFGDQMDFEKLRQLLSGQSSTYSKTVLSKMQQLFDLNLFDTHNAFDWSKITERDGKVTVIQLTSLDREIQTVITEMLMWDAWYSLVKSGDKTRPFVVVLDEAQNLSINDGSPAQKILQEGRKYGWSAWFATQFMKGALSSDEISRLQQAAETLYFKPSAEETSSVASMIADSNTSASEWNEILKQMQKGHCIVKGDRIRPNNTFGAAPAALVKVSSFEERT